MRKVLIDAHTHTVASGHAYSSLQEMAKAAADKGLEVLGITEHGPKVPGTCPQLYFKNMFVVPRQMYGIRLLMGCEMNILDCHGTLDLTEDYIDYLRTRGHRQWEEGAVELETMRQLGREHNDAEYFMKLCLSRPPETIANMAIVLIKQADYLLFKQLERLEKDFVNQGGFSERMMRVRKEKRGY